MKFKSIMHVSFFTDQMDVMRDFYENKLGLPVKIVTKAKSYLGLNRGYYSEIAPGQFIELFPKNDGQGPHDSRFHSQDMSSR